MAHWTNKLNNIPTPCYLIELAKLNNNLETLEKIKANTDCEIILALKAFSTVSAFSFCKSVLNGVTASSLYEARLAEEEFNTNIHIHAIGMDSNDAKYFNKIASHISFNSKFQLEFFKKTVKNLLPSLGLRVNPMLSMAPTDLYNPCGQYSRLGVPINLLNANDLAAIDGIHFHALCEQFSLALFDVLNIFEKKFGNALHQLKWMNWGGGHRLTDDEYDIDALIKKINEWKKKYGIQIILEPGDAVVRNSGVYIAKVMDIITNEKKIAICDISATAHMPDVLEYPYRPGIAGESENGKYGYIIAGNTCLAGDVIGEYYFDTPLEINAPIIFNDMAQYTLVKTSNFNGVKQPSVGMIHLDNTITIHSESSYFNFKERL
jgi:carboxynorspermidine decarboxylase